MKLVSEAEKKGLITKLLKMFNIDDKVIKKYLKSRWLKIGPIGMGGYFPNLWNPYIKNRKNLTSIFGSVVEMNGRQKEIKLEKIDKLYTALSKYLELKKNDKIYAAGEGIEIDKKFTTGLVELSPKEIPDFFKKCNFGFETVLFPHDLLWLFGFTHKLSFYLAGSREFVDEFKKFFPEYKDYKLEHTIVKKS